MKEMLQSAEDVLKLVSLLEAARTESETTNRHANSCINEATCYGRPNCICVLKEMPPSM